MEDGAFSGVILTLSPLVHITLSLTKDFLKLTDLRVSLQVRNKPIS